MFWWLINMFLFWWWLVLFLWFLLFLLVFFFWWIWLEIFFQIFFFLLIYFWFVFFWFIIFIILELFARINHLNSWVWWLLAGILFKNDIFWFFRDIIFWMLLRNLFSLTIWNTWVGDWKIMLGQIFKIRFFFWWRVRLEAEVKYIWLFFFLVHLLTFFFWFTMSIKSLVFVWLMFLTFLVWPSNLFWRILAIFFWKLTLVTLTCHQLFVHVFLWLIKYLDKMLLIRIGFLQIPMCWLSKLNAWYLLEC